MLTLLNEVRRDGGAGAAGRRSRAARRRDRPHRGHDRRSASSVTSRRRRGGSTTVCSGPASGALRARTSRRRRPPTMPIAPDGQPRPPGQHAGREVHPRRHRRRVPFRRGRATCWRRWSSPDAPRPVRARHTGAGDEHHLVAAAREGGGRPIAVDPVLQRAAEAGIAFGGTTPRRPIRRSPRRTMRWCASRGAFASARRRSASSWSRSSSSTSSNRIRCSAATRR